MRREEGTMADRRFRELTILLLLMPLLIPPPLGLCKDCFASASSRGQSTAPGLKRAHETVYGECACGKCGSGRQKDPSDATSSSRGRCTGRPRDSHGFIRLPTSVSDPFHECSAASHLWLRSVVDRMESCPLQTVCGFPLGFGSPPILKLISVLRI